MYESIGIFLHAYVISNPRSTVDVQIDRDFLRKYSPILIRQLMHESIGIFCVST